MSMLDFTYSTIMPISFSLLPPRMESDEAKIMLIAIGLQESRFQYRTQIGGPARGFWQFEELGGVKGVMSHPNTAPHAEIVCSRLQYPYHVEMIYSAIAHNDILACCFARLLLWSHPHALPVTGSDAWDYYIETWRPGKPHEETWGDYYDRAHLIVKGPEHA